MATVQRIHNKGELRGKQTRRIQIVRRPYQAQQAPSKDGPRINEMITATELLVIDDDGGKRGVMSKLRSTLPGRTSPVGT